MSLCLDAGELLIGQTLLQRAINEVRSEFPSVKHVVTLSPVPQFISGLPAFAQVNL